MQSGREDTLEERYAIKFCFKLGKKCQRNVRNASDSFSTKIIFKTITKMIIKIIETEQFWTKIWQPKKHNEKAEWICYGLSCVTTVLLQGWLWH